MLTVIHISFLFFFFNDTATTEIYTLSLHDALPISARPRQTNKRTSTSPSSRDNGFPPLNSLPSSQADRKSTRLNSSHSQISYAVFCLKKKKYKTTQHTPSSYTSYRTV